MPKVIIVIREVGREKPEYSLPFDLPEVPKAGHYISICRLDVREPFGEDLIVRHVWWRLNHSGEQKSLGGVTEIFVECDKAIGPYSTQLWKETLEAKQRVGITIERLPFERLVTPPKDTSP